jgi:hypothetical protein
LTDGYIYLGSPYSHPDPLVRETRYLQAMQALQTMLACRIWAYSPITHCHELAKIWNMPTDGKFWQEYNFQMLRSSKGLFVLKLEGWAKSEGLREEIAYTTDLNKTITFLSPGDVLHAAYIHRPNQDSAQPPAAGIR